MMDVVNQMRLHGEVVKDQKVVEKMMISVPPKFEAKISAIEESCDLDTLTKEKVEGAFRVSSRSNKGSTSQNFSSTSKKESKRHSIITSSQGVQQANVSEEDQVDDEYLFMASHRYVANASVFSVTEDDSMKWDKRNGHFNYRTLKHMNTTKLGVTDTDVLRTRPLVDVYESCNSVIEPKSYMDASKHFEWINAMKVKLEEEIYVKQPQGFEVCTSFYTMHSSVSLQDVICLIEKELHLASRGYFVYLDLEFFPSSQTTDEVAYDEIAWLMPVWDPSYEDAFDKDSWDEDSCDEDSYSKNVFVEDACDEGACDEVSRYNL
ncbi:hypothetical protein Tco_0432219, partial [Tanacetum coccineum]